MSAFLPIILGITTPVLAGQATGVEIADHRTTVRFDNVVDRATRFGFGGQDRIAVFHAGEATGSRVGGGGRVVGVPQNAYSARAPQIMSETAVSQALASSRFSDGGLTLTFEPMSIGEVVGGTLAPPGKLYLPRVAHRAAPPHSRFSVTIDIPAAHPGSRRPQILGPAGRPLVVIDPGHGGHDPGALGAGGLREKDLTLALAKSIRDELLRGGRVRVALTREDDRFLVLQERAEIARGIKADLFISIHADSAPGSDASGATIYTLSEVASGRNAASLATRENRADIINGVNLGTETSDVSSILIDLAQRETMNASARFADLVKREGVAVPFKRDYHQMAGFAVLKAPDTPAILFEVGYISSLVDLTRLNSVGGQRAIAQALRRAVDVHFARRMASR